MYKLALILIIGLGLRLSLVSQSFWLDEASQAQQSAMSVQTIWSQRVADFHPPLFYLLSHIWLWGGKSETWLRLLPVSMGLISIWLMYLLSREMLPDKKIILGKYELTAAEIAAFLLTINPYHIYYSAEFRMYSLLTLIGIWIMYLFLKSSRWLWVAIAVGLYTHYSTMLILLTLVGYLMWQERRKLSYFLSQTVVAFVVFIPWLPQFVKQLQSGVNIDQFLPGWRGVLSLGPLRAIPLTLFKLIAGRVDYVNRGIYSGYIGIVLVFLAISTLVTSIKRKFLVWWIVIPLVLSILVSFAIPITQPFRLIFILPALILVFTQIALRFPRISLLVLVYISLAAMVMYTTRPRLQKERWREASQFLQAEQTPDSKVLVKFSGELAPLDWYAPDLPVTAAIGSYPAKSEEVIQRLSATDEIKTWFVLDYLGDLTDPYDIVEKQLVQKNYAKIKTVNFEGVGFIDIYSKK